MNTPQTYKARLITKTPLTHDILELVFELLEAEMDFIPGQFVSLKLSDTVRRAYTLASSPSNKKGFRLIIRLVEQGEASAIFQQMQNNDEVEVLGPMGIATLRENTRPKLLLATGSGIAQSRAILEHIYEHPDRYDRVCTTLFFGVRYVIDIFWLGYFEDLARKYPHFQYQIFVSQPESPLPSGIRSGRMTQDFDQIKCDNMDIYMCGNGKAVSTNEQYFLERGVDPNQIIDEKFSSF